jgi:hypothetical protein
VLAGIYILEESPNAVYFMFKSAGCTIQMCVKRSFFRNANSCGLLRVFSDHNWSGFKLIHVFIRVLSG